MTSEELDLAMVGAKEQFSSDVSLVKLVYLDCCDIRMKRPMSLANWSLTAQQLCVRFGGWFAIL